MSYILIRIVCKLAFCRYLEASEAVIEEVDKAKLKTPALTCILNVAACKLKQSDWQGTIENCSEVKFDFLLFSTCI